MKSISIASASSFVLALVLAVPAGAADQHSQTQPGTQSQTQTPQYHQGMNPQSGQRMNQQYGQGMNQQSGQGMQSSGQQGLSQSNPDRQPVFTELDANQDGYISSQEARQYSLLLEQWGRLDRNNDQQLDKSEFSAFESGTSTGNTSGSPGQAPRARAHTRGSGISQRAVAAPILPADPYSAIPTDA